MGKTQENDNEMSKVYGLTLREQNHCYRIYVQTSPSWS
jgi:hypothetical protein